MTLCFIHSGTDVDAEESLKWLTKALKKILAVSSLSKICADALAPLQLAAKARAFVPPGQELVMLRMIERAALVLGYLHHDGEGTKADPGEACRLFRLAAACGSREGERVLGWCVGGEGWLIIPSRHLNQACAFRLQVVQHGTVLTGQQALTKDVPS